MWKNTLFSNTNPFGDNFRSRFKNYELTVLILLPARSYLLQVNKRNTRTRYEICSKLTIKIPERRRWHFWTYFTHCFSVSIVNFKQVIAGWATWKLAIESPINTVAMHRAATLMKKCQQISINIFGRFYSAWVIILTMILTYMMSYESRKQPVKVARKNCSIWNFELGKNQ